MDDFKEYETQLREIISTSSKGSQERKERRNGIWETISEKMASEGKSEEDIAKARKKFFRRFREMQKEKEVTTGTATLDPLLRMGISDNDGIKYKISDFLNTRLDEINIETMDDSINSTQYRRLLSAYFDSLPEEQKDNLTANLKKIRSRMTREGKKEKKTYTSKEINVDIGKYLGATNLSKSSVREDIYDYWVEVSKLYGKEDGFKAALDNFLTKAEQFSKVALLSVGRRNPERKQFLERFDSELKQIKKDYGDKNLEYIADFSRANVLVEKDPKLRLIAALDRIIAAKGLALKDSKIKRGDEEDEFLPDWENTVADAESSSKINDPKDYLEEELAKDVLDPEQGSEQYDSLDLTRRETDPLLAYELMRNTRLLALDQESQAILRETLETIREGETLLDFRTDLKNLISEVKETTIIDGNVFALPVSVLSNNEFRKFIQLDEDSKMVSAGKKEKISIDILEDLDEMFEKIHLLLTDRKFGFAVGVRTSGRGTVLGGSFGDSSSDARGTIPERLIREGSRRIPQSTGERGQLRPEMTQTKDLFDLLKKLLEAYAEYYINPLYVGRLPIEIPLYSTGRGARALSVFLKDVGGESLMGDTFEVLATTEKATISHFSMADLANFLVKLQSPNIRVNENLIDLAEDASIALTNMMGNEEKNRNYFAAVLRHFMDETEEYDMEKEDFFGKTITQRAKKYEKDFKERKPFPIFALPQFMRTNQSLMTKGTKRKTQYDRLEEVIQQVEDDLPIMLKMLLEAHDEIRKALGKEIIYGFLPLKHNSYGVIADMLYKKEQVDLSHLEVSSIIKSEDSHNNISKEYGITEDQVYLIKANFR
tara:strand:- start:6427 stop:8916 length:2490 start_codon:yes stop_codon:yes gene_type:complete